MRLIDLDYALEDVCRVGYYTADNIDRWLEELPIIDTGDLVIMKHGQWLWNDYGGFGNYHCSECRKICICNGDYDYCPNCGARMDIDETD